MTGTRAAVIFVGIGLCLASEVGAFVTPPSGIPARRAWGIEGKNRASSTDYSQSGSAAKIVADKTRNMRHQMRDAIWKATDTITKAVEDMPDTKDKKTLTRLGEWVEEIDEKYFGKYRGVGATHSYLESISTPQVEEKKKSSATNPSPKNDGGEGGKEKGAVADVKEKVSGFKQEATAAVEKAAESAAGTGSAPSGTVQLDRPKKVQGVFDELQKKAVAFYKQSPAGASGASKSSVTMTNGGVTPLPEKMLELEAELEGLLTGVSYQPRSLSKEDRSKLVDALKAMEDGYPEDAAPLGDPALPGEWSLVYSSSKNLVSRGLKGLFTRQYKMSEPRQVITPRTSTVENVCRIRLRLTPKRWRLSQTGTYKVSSIGGEKAARKVEVDYPAKKRSWLRRIAPLLSTGKVQTEITYLSPRWRICRSASGDATVAFRKMDPKK